MIETIDIKENSLLEIDSELLDILLKDRTTGENILWATDNYESLDYLYKSDRQILSILVNLNIDILITQKVEIKGI